MELIKTLSRTVSNALDYTVRKTGEMTDIARLKLRRTKVAEEINASYTKIGHLVYRQYRDGGDASAQIAELCLKVEQGNAEMQRIAESIEGIKLLAKLAAEEQNTENEDNGACMSEELFDTDEAIL